MKKATKRKTKPAATFDAEYRSAFTEYVRNGGEASLGIAYDLGRRAITAQKSLLEIASLHHHALHAMLSDVRGAAARQKLLSAAADFAAETFSPYEMAHRGVQDAIAALRQLNQTLEEEIKRIAYAVHDEAGQLLVAVHIALADVVRDLPDPQKQQVARIEELLNQVEAQLRRYSHELRPTVLDDLGWIPAIRFLADGVSKRANLTIQIETTIADRLPAPIEIVLYRIVQEALNNIAKHSRATHVCIRISRKNRIVCCSIEDDGVGFDRKAAQSNGKPRGLGLIGMQERLNAIGGTFAIDSAIGRGTKVSIRLTMEVSHATSRLAR